MLNRYDTAGHLTVETDKRKNTTVYTYDDADNILTAKEPAGITSKFEYDLLGNVLKEIDANGKATINPSRLL
ncbi:RHS repeat domain-containing protein [Paenilisteria weihenstephanensis]|uniref:RHS repeat domain-containing protein n=1 Tax=Listeria weihenstephanensis TaxID=1006155 RepID=UPI0004AF06FA|nr:RHS repeat domain-containing protein [Listeria weihenstephanensis]